MSTRSSASAPPATLTTTAVTIALRLASQCSQHRRSPPHGESRGHEQRRDDRRDQTTRQHQPGTARQQHRRRRCRPANVAATPAPASGKRPSTSAATIHVAIAISDQTAHPSSCTTGAEHAGCGKAVVERRPAFSALVRRQPHRASPPARGSGARRCRPPVGRAVKIAAAPMSHAARSAPRGGRTEAPPRRRSSRARTASRGGLAAAARRSRDVRRRAHRTARSSTGSVWDAHHAVPHAARSPPRSRLGALPGRRAACRRSRPHTCSSTLGCAAGSTPTRPAADRHPRPDG